MARDLLSEAKIKRLPPGEHSDGDGLHLRVRPSANGKLRASWAFQYVVLGKRTRLGLGPYPALSLSAARTLRDDLQGARLEGIDPKDYLRERRAADDVMTVSEAVTGAYEQRTTGMKDGRTWRSTLDKHILPVIGDRNITTLTAAELEALFAPLWKSIPDGANKALMRLRLAFLYADDRGLPVNVEMISRVRRLLGARKVATKGHAAAPLEDLPRIYQAIGDASTPDLALRFTLLTAARSGEVRFMGTDEVAETPEGWVWTIPPERLKSYRPDREANPAHRVALSDEALHLYQAARAKHPWSPLAFPGRKPGKAMTDMTLAKKLKQIADPIHVTLHGTARSGFRDWAALHAPEIPPDVIEVALAHKIGTVVERSYLRTDFLEMRRNLMDRWAVFLTGTGHQ